MVQRAEPFGSRLGANILALLPYVALCAWAIVLVLAHSTGRIETGRAVLLLAFPIAAVGVAIRPAWVVLFFAAAPVVQIQIAPTRGLVLLLLFTLACQLVMRGRLEVGLRSGFVGFLVLLGGAYLFAVDLTGTDALVTRGFLNNLALMTLLGLVAYNATRAGDLKGTPLVNALVVGLGISVILEFAVFTRNVQTLGSGVLPAGRGVAYLAAAGFVVCFARVVVRTEKRGYYYRGLHMALAAGFLVAMVPSLARGAWVGAIIAVLSISVRAHKTRYWALVLVALIVIFAAPVARERVVPSERLPATGGYTTGRLDLWTQLWSQIEPALPLGNGFGHTFTLTSEDLFGEGSTSFGALTADTFVYPHNDFLFWMVELGLLGLLGIGLFWGQLMWTLRRIRRTDHIDRYHVETLAGVLTIAFVAQLVISTFLFLPLGSALSIVAGFVHGTYRSVRT